MGSKRLASLLAWPPSSLLPLAHLLIRPPGPSRLASSRYSPTSICLLLAASAAAAAAASGLVLLLLLLLPLLLLVEKGSNGAGVWRAARH